MLPVITYSATVSIAAEVSTENGFVGSGQCRQCHQEIYTEWWESDHRKAMLPADETSVLGNFDHVTVEFHGVESRFFSTRWPLSGRNQRSQWRTW